MEDEDEIKALTERIRELEEHMLFIEEHFNVSPHKPELMFPKNINAIDAIDAINAINEEL